LAVFVGQRVDRYEVLFPVASGGMAHVYGARLRAAAGVTKLLAVKVLKRDLATDTYFVDLFIDECRIAARIEHPNVVRVFDVVMHDGLPCMVMEFLRGQSLSRLTQRLARTGQRLTDRQIACVLSQAGKGLDAAHRLTDHHGHALALVHRDVSPENVHVGYDGLVKVVDFGIASTRARLTETRPGEFKGKVAYAAPERIHAADDVDARSDVWSLGVMAWQLFAGRELFEADDEAARMWKIVNGDVRDLAEHRPDLDPLVRAAIMNALRRAPDDRTVTAGALADVMQRLDPAPPEELASVIAGAFERERIDQDHVIAESVDAPTGTDPMLDERPSTPRRRWLPGLVAASIVTVAAAGVWAATRGAPVSPPESPAAELPEPTANAAPVVAAPPRPAPEAAADDPRDGDAIPPDAAPIPATTDLRPEPGARPSKSTGSAHGRGRKTSAHKREPKAKSEVFRNPYPESQ
jgi:serine/threonine-protein kinase